MDVRCRGSQRFGDDWKRLRSVDEDLECVARPRRSAGDRPPAGRRLERVPLANPREASQMVAGDLLRDLLTEPCLDGEDGPIDRAERSDARAQILR
jgi:hypothetical protein